jgi:undecaprenyl-diphosphatase
MSAAAATALSDARPRLRPLWWALAAVMAASRVYVRAHHASDVVVGFALGAGTGRAARPRGGR